MARVNQLDRRSGITYVYESRSYWDREKKQPRSKRTLIGRLDPETGEILPTDGRGRRRGEKKGPAPEGVPKSAGGAENSAPSGNPSNTGASQPGGSPPSVPLSSRRFFSATEILDRIADRTGIAEDLKNCFPDRYLQILSIIYYLAAEDRGALRRFDKWASLHAHPCGESISPSRMEELFASVDLGSAERFFALQGKRRADENGFSIYTVPFPNRAEGDRPRAGGKAPVPSEQITLALVFSEQSGLPFRCGRITGAIPDASSIRDLLRDVVLQKDRKIKPLLNLGYRDADELSALIKKRVRFLCEASAAPAFVREFLRDVSGGKERLESLNAELGLYIFTRSVVWDVSQDRPRKGDTGKKGGRLYIHLYYSPEKRLDDSRAFDRRLETLKDEILGGNRIPEHEKDYRRYFDLRKTSKKEIALSSRQSAVAAARERFGFSVLVSSDVADPVTALKLHRAREAAERSFGDINERFCLQKTASSSETALEGKLLTQFAALICQSCLRRRLEEREPFPARAAQELFDRLDLLDLAALSDAGGSGAFPPGSPGRQEELFRDLGFEPQ